MAGASQRRCAAHTLPTQDHMKNKNASWIQAKLSAQMLRAQAHAYWPSKALVAAETPPEPGTVSMVFLSAS
jgi:hypothetical protein